MNHPDHVSLIRGGVEQGGHSWADLGSGAGAFTLALAEVLGRGATIYSVDRDADALRRQARVMHERFPDVELRQLAADFIDPLELPTLDGIVMANSLHFVRDKRRLLPRILAHLRAEGRFILVEYDSDHGNRWVPHPISCGSWKGLAGEVGLRETRLLQSVPSRFLGSIYSAVSLR